MTVMKKVICTLFIQIGFQTAETFGFEINCQKHIDKTAVCFGSVHSQNLIHLKSELIVAPYQYKQ